ncbi:MAG: hypothetical protein ACLVD4_03975 [Negativibacillus sp.]
MKAADKLIAIALAVGSLLFLGWLVLRFFLPATLPFWLGLAIAALLRPVSLLFSQKLHLRRRRAAAFVMTCSTCFWVCCSGWRSYCCGAGFLP